LALLASMVLPLICMTCGPAFQLSRKSLQNGDFHDVYRAKQGQDFSHGPADRRQQRTWVTCLYLLGLSFLGLQIAKEVTTYGLKAKIGNRP
jgi:hypothetical protein